MLGPPEQIIEKQRNLIQNIQRLAEMEDPEFTDFWQLLSYHNAITPDSRALRGGTGRRGVLAV